MLRKLHVATVQNTISLNLYMCDYYETKVASAVLFPLNRPEGFVKRLLVAIPMEQACVSARSNFYDALRILMGDLGSRNFITKFAANN